MAAQTPARTVEEIENNVSEASHVHMSNERPGTVHVVVDESDVGQFYQTVRQIGAETDTFRSDDTIRGWVDPNPE